MERDSRTACLPSVVLTIRATSSFFIISTTCGRPSRTLLTRRQTMPASSSTLAVPPGGRDLEAARDQHLRQLHRARLVAVAHAHEAQARASAGSPPRPPAPWHTPRRRCCPVPMTSPVDFISGPRIGSASGNLMNGNTASLTEKYGGMRSAVRPCAASDLAGHDARRDLGERNAGGLGDERHGARGARVDLQDVDDAALDRELDVHQADHVERLGELARLRAQLLLGLRRQAVRRQRAARNRPSARRPARCAP